MERKTKEVQALEQTDKVLVIAYKALNEIDRMLTTLEAVAHTASGEHDIGLAFAVADMAGRYAKLMGVETDEIASDITIARHRIADGLAEPEAEEEAL